MNFEKASVLEQSMESLKISTEIPKHSSAQRNGQLLLGTTFTDGKTSKNFFDFLSKLHTRTTLEFYKSGIWGVQKREDPKNTSYQNLEAVSTVHFPEKGLENYTINLELLPNYNPNEEDKAFFSLNFETEAILTFLKTMGADSAFALTYNYGSDTMFFINDDTQTPFPLPVTFSLTAIAFPLSGNITSVEFNPKNKTRTKKFSPNVNNLTKVKDQLAYDQFIDIQIIDQKGRCALLVHSSERKFHQDYPQGLYNKAAPPDISFLIKSEIMKGLASISKINEHGFLEFFFVDSNILRISTYIGNFGRYNLYIINKKITGR